ncbi:DUF4328 domain-containing protein [Amycolatopsis australiensis]|uniref:DUF4328 domain-containing protein n=1 Tax=Amycolatopsis australiensis TaxID=546364 RepID=A0A1K1PYB6_9PSEU|nr:DUF4328 domain-containing protein [Amycolatopsis australiensis]SFW51846.1 protein of unknown function [Amycolatopsis australiensis]
MQPGPPPGYWPRQNPPPTAQQLQGRNLAAQPEPYPYQRRPVYRPKLRWVATPPPGAWPHRRVAPPERYLGPPSYPVPPRWGFPNLVWRRPTSVPGTASDEIRPIDRLPVLSRSLIGILFGFAVLAAVAAGAEIWRYVLLVEGREAALNRSVVAFSDGFVLTAGLLASILALLPAGLAIWWLLVARQAAADVSGDDPPRPVWQVLVGILVPVVNLPMALSIVSELEHAVLGRPRDIRPKPSRQVLVWWGAWLLNWILLGVTIAWRFRDDVQSMADSVVLVALTDLSAAVLAVVTALVVRRFSALLAPSDARAVRSMRVLKVAGAPEPELRPSRPAGAAR